MSVSFAAAKQPALNAVPAPQDSFITSDATVQVDLVAQLSESDKESLQDISFELPSLFFKNKNIEEAF